MKSAVASLVLLVSALAGAADPTILAPPAADEGYRAAADAFADVWRQVTQRRPKLVVGPGKAGDPLPAGDLVVIGSDAVQPCIHELILKGAIESLAIRYGSDDYCLKSLGRDGRTILLVVGGSARSTAYAVYDFFRRRAGAEYFWDGDHVPHRDSIDLAGLDLRESPHFEHRGLRYFAHRGLHRFQAEHWDLDDWKHEIDWLLKKRFNLFMLRTGIDDLFQRAFADVPYPPTDRKDPDGVDRSYDDRTSFWPLRYRGELRKAVLRYAVARGLLHPEDTGTPTHWYSHTPGDFFRNRPGFPVTGDQKTGYKLPTHAIWDIEDQRAWDAYWQLTETHIREFGQSPPRMFHTIGLAERTFGDNPRDNLQRKLYVYRKTQERIRRQYTDAPLLIAGWDFIAWWSEEDVRRLLTEFDPSKTIIFDYTADVIDKPTFKVWNLLGNFPWLFGIFHSYARNSDIHEDYGVVAERLKMAAADRYCRGLAVWSEISHSDTFLLEYLAANSWQPSEYEIGAAVDRYCGGRYPPELAAAMRGIWTDFLVAAQTVHWTIKGPRWASFGEPHHRLLSTSQFSTLPPERLAIHQTEFDRIGGGLAPAPAVLDRLASLVERHDGDPLWRRDVLDIARTLASRAILAGLLESSGEMEAWRAGKKGPERIEQLAAANRRLYDRLADVLALSDDFSMAASLRRLERAEPLGGVEPTINPHAEQTLKSNAENDYCRSHHYELARHVYRPEADVFWDWVLAKVQKQDRGPWRRPKEFSAAGQQLRDRFYATPLADMAPTPAERARPLAEVLRALRDDLAAARRPGS